MTNVTMKSSLTVLSVFAITLVFSMGTFATIVNAQEDLGGDWYGGGEDLGGSWYGSEDLGGGWYGGGEDLGGDWYGGGEDLGGGWYGGEDLGGGWYGGGEDLGGDWYSGDNAYTYEPNGCGNDCAYTYEPTGCGNDCAFTYEPTGCGNDCAYTYEPTGCGGNCEFVYYGEEYIVEEGIIYSEQSYGGQQSYGGGSSGYGGGSRGSGGGGGGFSMPSFGRAPSTSYPSYPTPQPQRPQQQQQQQQQQGGGQPINIVNTNNNNNINTNTNTSAVIPVYQTPVTYPVQYVYPQQPVYPTYPTQNTYCVITASPTSISNGQAAYLTWSSTGATSAWLSDGIGQVAVNGSLAVRPNNSKTYTLTVSGYGGTTSCNVYISVNGSYISLSQIPYTGFDAGLLGNVAYWLSLISFAVAGSYLALYYKGGAMTLVGSMLGSRTARTSNVAMHETVQVPAEVETKIEIVETPVETMTPSPIDVMEHLPVAPTANATMDSMQVMHSKEGAAPRIIITRN